MDKRNNPSRTCCKPISILSRKVWILFPLNVINFRSPVRTSGIVSESNTNQHAAVPPTASHNKGRGGWWVVNRVEADWLNFAPPPTPCCRWLVAGTREQVYRSWFNFCNVFFVVTLSRRFHLRMMDNGRLEGEWGFRSIDLTLDVFLSFACFESTSRGFVNRQWCVHKIMLLFVVCFEGT